MFSNLCRARLWPKTKLKVNGSGPSCTAEQKVDAEENPKETVQEQKSTFIKVSGTEVAQQSVAETSPSQELVPKEDIPETETVKRTIYVDDYSQLELYLKWLLQISDSRNILRTQRCSPKKNSSGGPAYTLKPPVQRVIIPCQDRVAEVKRNEEVRLLQPAIRDNSHDSKVPGTEPPIRLPSPTPLENKDFKSDLKLEKLGRCDTVVRYRPLVHEYPYLKPFNVPMTKSKNRIRKRCSKFTGRRLKNLQHQNVVDEVSCSFQMKLSKSFPRLRKITIGKVESASQATVPNQPTDQVSESATSPPNTRVKNVGLSNPSPEESQLFESEVELQNATKKKPANSAMVVMRFSRFLSHLRGEPPYMESSLSMGTLVTALWRENEWLYVRTAHGHEGYVYSNCCLPLGTLPKGRTWRQKYNLNRTSTDLRDCESCSSNESKDVGITFSTKQVLKSTVNENIPFFCPESTSTLIKKKARIPLGKL